MQITMKSNIKLSDLIIAIQKININQSFNFCLYSKDSMVSLTSNTICYIDEYPIEGEDGEDVFPKGVADKGLELCYYGEQFVDVINNVISQIDNPVMSVFINALNYYMDNDDFLNVKL